MFLARCKSETDTVVGIGLTAQDLESLVARQPRSFALSEAYAGGDERVLLAYLTPAEMEQVRMGYYPAVTDARVLLYLNYEVVGWLRAGKPLQIHCTNPDLEVGQFVVFIGEGRADAERAFQQVGLPIRPAAYTPAPDPTPRFIPDQQMAEVPV